MQTAWFVLLALMIAMYVVLDGFDLGIGALHRILPRSDAEREEATGTIGPVWDGNEVWLIAAGGVLFLAFPVAYAAAFSGLYLGMILLLWLLVGRALGLELRHQLDNPLWRAVCDTVFWLSSAALGLVLGVALGNVVRGVPLGADGYFHLSLFQILNGYAVLIGLFALVVLAAHGASFLAAFASGELAARAGRLAHELWWAELAFLAGIAYPTYMVREGMLTAFGDHPWRLVFPALALGALAAAFAWQRREAWRRAFAASCAFIAGLLATTAAALYPSLLPAREGGPFGLTVHNAASGEQALRTALFWWPVGIALAAVYLALSYRHFVLRRAGAPMRGVGG
ncbi:MAG: cytochrome bd ubiquinol oxidase subunit [Solirubrobacteraceae bacterium]|jgi:cytochrome d ubiquinol oxidase subunit II|nr:cytochrome bd ubiquinol oxidase subunit [Solirubrobacteraceae bacterium]